MVMNDPKNDTAFGAAGNEAMLFGFIGMLWRERRMVITGMALGLTLAAAYLHLATFRYTASLHVTAVSAQQQLPSGLTGLASLAGVSLGDDEVSPVSLYVETLKSEDVAVELARDEGVLRHFFPEHWSGSENGWREPQTVSRRIVNVIKRLFGYPAQPWHAPGAKDLRRRVTKSLAVTRDSRTNLTLIAFNDADPVFAVSFLKKMHAAADGHLRARALQRANQNTAYLRERVADETNVDFRAVLVDLLSSQERLKMLASARSDFAAQPLGSVTASARTTTPKPPAVLAFGAIGGLAVGIVLASWTSRDRRRMRHVQIADRS